MIQPAWTTVVLGEDAARALAEIPAAPGVAQIRGRDAQNLMIGRGADMRRFAAANLGLGKPPARGVRPRVDLRPIAEDVVFAPTASGFMQRLVYERLMARYVPLQERRDLKTPAYLQLDRAARFPRVELSTEARGRGTVGPFRDRAAAQRAQAALHKLFPLRPCDFVFEPHPELALGVACLYAQVRSCAAPCLGRTSEDDYRALAATAAQLLEAAARDAEPTLAWLPPWVGPVRDAQALVVEDTSDGLQIYPVHEGRVREERAFTTPAEDLASGLVALDWSAGPERGDDLPWLASWLYMPKRTGHYVRLGSADPTLAARMVKERLSAGS